MGSSGIVDSGKIPAKRSNFSQTCSLLSQYLKDNGSFGEVANGFSRNSEIKGMTFPVLGFQFCWICFYFCWFERSEFLVFVSTPETKAPIRTMDLLPMIEKSGHDSDAGVFSRGGGGPEAAALAKSEAEGAQLTIFYAGQVIVFNDFPAEKASELMYFARKSSSAAQTHPLPTYSPPMTGKSAAESVASFRFPLQERDQPPLGSDLPIARKNSLARFLAKRRDRIAATEPYPARKQTSPSPSPSRSQAWD